MTENITISYKKTNTAAINNINKEAKCIAERLHLDDGVEQFNQREAFVTLKITRKLFEIIRNAGYLTLQNLKLASLVTTTLKK